MNSADLKSTTQKHLKLVHSSIQNNTLLGVFVVETMDLFKVNAETFAALEAIQEGRDHPALHQSELIQEIGSLLAGAEAAERERLSSTSPLDHTDVDHLALNINQICNLRCHYCYAAGDGTYGFPTKHIPFELAQKAISDLISATQKTAVRFKFFGGESLLSWKLCLELMDEAARIASTKNISISFDINTNGTLLTEEIVRAFSHHSVRWIVSLDGDKENHDAVRVDAQGRGTFDRVLKGLDVLKGTGQLAKTQIQCVVHGQSKNMSAQWLFLKNFQPAAFNLSFVIADKNSEFHLTDEKTKAIMDHFKEQAIADIQGCGRTMNHWLHSSLLQLEDRAPVKRACEAGRSLLAVDSRGNYLPCHRFTGLNTFILGRVEDGLPEESKRKPFYEDHLKAQEACGTCWARTLCGGGCMAAHFMLTGNHRIPSQEGFCRDEQRRQELALELFLQLKSTQAEACTNKTVEV